MTNERPDGGAGSADNPCQTEDDKHKQLTDEIFAAQKNYDTDAKINALDEQIKRLQAQGETHKKDVEKLQDKRVNLATPHTRGINKLREKLKKAESKLDECREKHGLKPRTRSSIELNGHWIDGSREIVITHSGNTVRAEYVEDRECNPGDGTPILKTKLDFDATLTGNQVEGMTNTCKYGSEDPMLNGFV
jgi:predicted RNase H-like nuclease (RuvC/YqgF family)